MARVLVLAALAGLVAGSAIRAETPPKGDCVEIKPAPTANEAAKGTAAGVAKDGPGTTGWSSGNSEAGIQKDGQKNGEPAAPDAKQPETAKGLDPTKHPC